MATKAAQKKIAHEESPGFTAVFEGLKAILVPYAGQMKIVHDTPDYYYLDTTFPVYRDKPAMFASVKRGKAYVSYHLLPLYMNPALNSHVSAELKKRKQGKACFNFSNPDPKLFAELAELTRLGLESFKKFAQSQAAANPGKSKGKKQR
jgi:hypothetical protein